jgi:hypothetical protein
MRRILGTGFLVRFNVNRGLLGTALVLHLLIGAHKLQKVRLAIAHGVHPSQLNLPNGSNQSSLAIKCSRRLVAWSRSLIEIRIKLGFLDQAEQSSEDLTAIGNDDDDDQQKGGRRFASWFYRWRRL